MGLEPDHVEQARSNWFDRIHFPLTHGRTSVQVFIDTGRSVDGEFPHVPDLAVSMDIVISGRSDPCLDEQEDNNTVLISRTILRTSGYPRGSPIFPRAHQSA